MSALRQISLCLSAGLVLLAARGPLFGQNSKNADKTAAVVNGEIITLGEVELMIPPSVVPLPAEQRAKLYQAYLEMLIDDHLLHQFLRKNAPPPNQAEVDKEWRELQDALSKRKQTLAEFLKEARQTEAQLRADIAARVQWRSYINAKYSDAELRAYYQANKVFFDKTFVQASHILKTAGKDARQRETARQALEVIRQDILAKKITFADAARKYSDCPSRDKGGDIGKFPYIFVVVEPFAKAAFAMKVGEISRVVESEAGLHLILVTNRIEGPPSTFEAVRETVRETYAQDRGLYQNILNEQRGKAVIRREPLEILVK